MESFGVWSFSLVFVNRQATTFLTRFLWMCRDSLIKGSCKILQRFALALSVKTRCVSWFGSGFIASQGLTAFQNRNSANESNGTITNK